MISKTWPPGHDIASVIEVVEQRTMMFLRDELGLVVESVERCLRHKESLVLRAMTAIVGVGSQAGFYIAYTYDDSLIRAMARRHTVGLPIAPEEEELYARETASDVVNIIVGNCTTDFAQRGELISLSPPVLLTGARTIHGSRDTTIASLTLCFSEGTLDVAFVGPRLRFDDQLNYQDGV